MNTFLNQKSWFNQPKKKYDFSGAVLSAASERRENNKASTPANTKNTQSAVRDYLVSQGLSNNKIGWDDPTKTVTYNNQPLISPSRLENGKSYANISDLDNAISAYKRNNATVPVRSTMLQDGFLNHDIGYNSGTGYITLNGKEIARPAKIENGVSYMTQEDYDNMKSNIGSGLVNLSDYAAKLGMPGDTKWFNDGTATLNGRPIKIQQIKTDGNKSVAFVNKADIDRIYNEWSANNPNILSAYNEYNSYKPRIDRALRRIENPPEFEYDLEDDPAYRAYRDAAVRNGNLAYEDTLARAAGMTGGFSNTYAAMAAEQAKLGYLDSLNDRIPELYQAAYDRYNAERGREYDRLESVLASSSQQLSNDMNTAMLFAQLANEAYDRNRARQTDDYNITEKARLEQKEDDRYTDEIKRYEDERKREDEETAFARKLSYADWLTSLYNSTKNPYYYNQANMIMKELYGI